MITADLHVHTLYSHGQDTPRAMWESAAQKGIELLGFTEHSPRPEKYTYSNEYREKLTKFFPQYVKEVKELKAENPGKILLGIEMDWMEKDVPFIKNALSEYDFDYHIGSVHFLQTWGYDDDPKDWRALHTSHCFEHYEAYFTTIRHMAESRLFHIAGHLDLIKIFSIENFKAWIENPVAQILVAEALKAIKDAGMALEVSSAGLRKACKEIYPGPHIMELAKDIQVPISFASDAHNVGDVAADFTILADYARSYGYKHSVWYCGGQVFERPF